MIGLEKLFPKKSGLFFSVWGGIGFMTYTEPQGMKKYYIQQFTERLTVKNFLFFLAEVGVHFYGSYSWGHGDPRGLAPRESASFLTLPIGTVDTAKNFFSFASGWAIPFPPVIGILYTYNGTKIRTIHGLWDWDEIKAQWRSTQDLALGERLRNFKNFIKSNNIIKVTNYPQSGWLEVSP
jgi:hypothetical protein